MFVYACLYMNDWNRTPLYSMIFLNISEYIRILLEILFFSFFYSLFAAKTGASRVIAIEASEKMASVATQVCFSVV